MSEIESILAKLQHMGLEDTKLVGQAVRDHLEELDEIEAYDSAKSKDEEIESLDAVLARYKSPKAT